MSDLAAVDWRAFTTRWGFDNAGHGDQPPHASETALLGAFSIDDEIPGSGESLLKRAVEHDAVPLTADDHYPRYYFADEVLR